MGRPFVELKWLKILTMGGQFNVAGPRYCNSSMFDWAGHPVPVLHQGCDDAELPDESDRNTACGMPAQALTWLHDECCILVLHA